MLLKTIGRGPTRNKPKVLVSVAELVLLETNPIKISIIPKTAIIRPKTATATDPCICMRPPNYL